MGCGNVLPHKTSMLTKEHKEARVQWAIRHKDYHWNRKIFTDETCYQLFRNTVCRWSKNPKTEIKRIPKNQQKIMVWERFSAKGLIGCHSFTCIMNATYYDDFLQNHLLHNAKKQFGRRWRF